MKTRLYFLMFKISISSVLIIFCLSPAAATGGYPFAQYAGPRTDPGDFVWTNGHGGRFSPYGYIYRNCTDFAAWKAVSLGVSKEKVKGLGNGGQWAENAKRKGLEVNATPRMWGLAVSSAGGYGHVAFVEEVLGGGVIKVSEYNFASPGVYGTRQGTPSQLGFSKFITLGISPPQTPPPPPAKVIRLKKTRGSDGVHLLYSALSDAVFESWWHPGQGVRTSRVMSAPGIVDIDKRELRNGTHLLYTAVTDGVYETWWRPGEGLHTAKIISLQGVRRVITEQQPDGTHTLYVLARDGPYEFWWRDGGTIQGGRLAHIIEPVALVKSYGADGSHQLITATAGSVFETAWRPGQPLQTRQLIGIAQADIVDVAKHTLPDGTELLYTAVTTGVWETWWRAGRSPTHSKIAGSPAVRRIEKQVASDGTHLLYITAEHEVKEYWWQPGRPLMGCRLLAASSIHDIEKSEIGQDHLLYTAAGPNAYETWWQAGESLHTTEIGSFD